MAKVLALDIGTKRTGIAETDPFQIIATGLKTISTTELLFFLDDYLKTEDLECLVVGEPKRLHGVASDVEKYIGEIVNQIQKAFPTLKIERIDERFTSKIASQTIANSGLKKKKKQNKALIDEVSAVIILQSWMQKNQRL